MTKEELAALLNGREYLSEMTHEEEAGAKAAGLAVFFGYSDDNIEVRGVANDEAGAYGGNDFLCDREGFILDWETVRDDLSEDEARQYFERKGSAIPVTAKWDVDGYYWVISTDLPFAPFDVVEDGEKFCRGIVVDLSAALGMAPEGGA